MVGNEGVKVNEFDVGQGEDAVESESDDEEYSEKVHEVEVITQRDLVKDSILRHKEHTF